MSFHRLVLLSGPEPTCSTRDVLEVCHAFPDRMTQAGIGGALVSDGRQFALLLEGGKKMVERLAQRIIDQVPESDMAVRFRQTDGDRAFRGWSIEDLYLDEVAHRDPADAEQLGDALIDLLAGVREQEDGEEPGRDPFAESAELVERYAAATRPAASAAA